ncbi:MAG: hypothetical protein KGL13_02060, partial [Gammaproteobacteria bacterium]|nr:hypothetical protein [Gammaproteobacteria bacterium]
MNIQDSPTGPGTGQRRSTLDSAIKPRPSPAPVTEHEFALAVHQALRDYQRTDLLRSSPLLGTRLLQDALARSPGTPPTQMLREVLRSHSEALGQNPKTDRFQQVLQHTYLMPMRSQQAVADALHLSWSTYRRCLAGAVRMLSAALWETETALQAASGDQSVSRHPLGFWLVTASLVLLAIAVSGSVYWQIHRRRRESLVQNPGPVTLAVLPFMDLDPQSGSRYLSDGITDELITRLGRNPHLRVVAHTSSFSLRNKPLDVRDVGRILGVTHIVEGSLQKAGNILRIHVALVSAVSGYELWSGELDMPQHDIFKTEDSIAESILGHLHVPLEPANSGVAASPRAVNPEARDAYLVGLEYLNNRTDDDINQSIVYFHRAIQADPDYAEPWAGLATA